MFLLSDRVKKKVFIYIRIRIGINILGWIRIRIKQIRTHKIPVKTMHCYRWIEHPPGIQSNLRRFSFFGNKIAAFSSEMQSGGKIYRYVYF